MRLLSASVALLFASHFTLRAAAPPNDNFNNALLLTGTNVTVNGTNVDATKEVGEPNHGENVGGKSIWWKWTAPGSGSVIIHTSGSSFDTLLAAYTGASVAQLSDSVVASNDDVGASNTSLIGFNVIAGTTYRVAVDGYNGASGDVHLQLTFRTTPIQRPANDDFAHRTPLRGAVVNSTGSNLLASKEANEPDHAEEIGGGSVWWTWTAPAVGTVVITTEGSNLDTLLAVYRGSTLTNLMLVASNDDVATNVDPTSLVTFAAIANTAYQIAVDGYDGEPGDIQLHITMTGVLWMDTPQPVPDGGYNLRLTGVLGKEFAIQTSTDLLNWQPLATVPNSNGVVEFTDGAATNSTSLFYRALEVP